MSSPSLSTPTSEPVAVDSPVTYSIDETAAILRVNRKTIVAMIERGELPSVRYARRRWVPARAVRNLLMMDIPSRVVPSRAD